MLSNRVLYNLISKRFAGHSKWANIKHTKAIKDAQKGALFTKFSRQIKIAIQEGGSASPDSNLRLSQIIEQAKKNSMPVATIQNVIKSMNAKKDLCKPGLIEMRGPSGSIILCEIFTDNLTRTKQTLATILKKHNFSFSDGGGRHLFESKGIVEVQISVDGKSEEELIEIAMEHAIESGAEDVKINGDDSIKFICEPKQLRNVHSELEKFNYNITNSCVEYIPRICIQLEENDLENLSVMYDKLENQEDVVRLFDNIG